MPILRVEPDGAVSREADESSTTLDRADGAALVGQAVRHGWLTTPGEDPLVPTSVSLMLAEMSPRLGCAFNRDLQQFTFTLRWADGDPRYQTIGSAYPYEILGMFDPQSISPLEVATWMGQRVALLSASREDVRQMVAEQERVHEAKRAAREAQLRDVGKQAIDDALTQATDVGAAKHGKRRTKVDVPKGDVPKGA